MGKRGRRRKRSGKPWVFLLLVSFVLVALAIWGATRFAAAGRSRPLRRASGKVATPAHRASDEIAPHERRQLQDILERSGRN